MGWIAITPLAAEQDGGQSANRARQALLNRQGAGELMPRGTLMIEARVAAAGRPVSLMSVDHIHPWHGAFSVNVLPGGSISLLQRQNDTTRHAVLQIPPGEHAELIRLTFVWDAPARCARLWLEWPEEDTLPVRVDMADPMPIPSDALCFAILASEHGTQHIADPLGASRTAPAEEVDFVALSDEIEPIGPLPGLARDVPVMTPTGARALDQIAPGDLVTSLRPGTPDQPVPVLARIVRALPARGSFRPVRLNAPYFGLRADVTFAANQRIVLAGSDVEYLFEREKVLVPVRHLISDRQARYLDGPDVITWAQLLLPEQQELRIAGCPVESLHVGRLRRDAEAQAAGLLADVPRRILPHHAATVYPVLRSYEATSLTSLRAV